MSPRRRALVVAPAAAVAAFLAATGAESALIRLAGANRAELEWISDVILSGSFGLAAWLWLHLRATRAELTRMERARIALDTQLALAGEIQRNLLPQMPAPAGGVSFAARMVPAGKIGGDFYDVVTPSADTVVLILGDVSGKGIPAALAMAAVVTLFRDLTRVTDDPAILTERLSRSLYDANHGEPYLTCIVARLHRPSLCLRYVNAGHPHGLVMGAGPRHELASTSLPAGILPDVAFAAAELVLGPRERLILVTDGVTEAVERKATLTPSEHIARAVDALGRAAPAGAICDALLAMADAGEGPPGVDDWQDDATALVLSVDRRTGVEAAE